MVGAEANSTGSLSDRCPSESAEKRRMQWLTLYHLRGEESDLEVLQPWTLSGERIMQQVHALHSSLPSAKTSLIKVHPGYCATVKIMSSRANAAWGAGSEDC